MFGKRKDDSHDEFKRTAAKGMSYAITRGMEAMIEEFDLDEDKAQMTFIRAFEGALSESVGKDAGFFVGKNKELKDLLADDE